MKRKSLKITIALLLLIGPVIHAQFQNGLWTGEQANYWYMGQARGFNFNTSPPELLTDGMSYAPTNGGTISTPEGSLLFYTDGQKIWNRNHLVMPNGNAIGSGAQATQSGLTIPAPGHPDLYYVFTVAKNNTNGGIFYSEVDMTLDSGFGNVIAQRRKIRLHPAGVAEKLTAVYHADEKNVWLIGHRANHEDAAHNNEFVAYLITESGIETTPVTSAVGLPFNQYKDGQMKFSPDGKKIALVHSQGGAGPNVLEVFNFDAMSGQVSSPILTIDDRFSSFISLWGLEFSPNSELLYTTEIQSPTRLYQYDLTSGNEAAIRNSEVIIYEITDISDTFFGMQVGPDGKIYVANGNRNHYSVINNPNNRGTAAGFQYAIAGTTAANADNSYPGFVQSYFESGILHGPSCVGDLTQFSLLRIPGITSVAWNFGDAASADNTSSVPTPSHKFSAPGIYTVTATIVSNNATQVSVTQVKIYDLPVAHKPNDLTYCDLTTVGNHNFDLQSQNQTILGGQQTNDFSISFYSNNTDAQLGNNPITGDLTQYNSMGERIYARLENNASGCFSTTDFLLVVVPPIVSEKLEVTGCSPIDLTVLLNRLGAPAEEFAVSFHSSESNARENTEPVANPQAYVLQSGTATIYLRITQISTGCVSILPSAITKTGCSLPEGFSPNGDNINDTFDLGFLASQSGITSFEVFNRNGRQVYKKYDYSNQWAGEDNNGNNLPSGTYFYVASLKNPHPQYGQAVTKWVYLQAKN